MSALDEFFPIAGPCGICGGPDQRHRVWDAIVEQHNAGESVESLARDFAVSTNAVQAVIDNWDAK